MDEKEDILTVEKLKAMKPGLFSSGSGLYPALYEKSIRWAAVRGEYHDWTIYYGLKSSLLGDVMAWGDKCFSEGVIRELVPCDDEAFGMYRL